MANPQAAVLLPRRLDPRLILPVLFVGYALVANFAFVTGLVHDTKNIPQSAADYLDGAAAARIDGYYKSILPHRAPSIDLLGALRYLALGEGRPGVIVGKDGWLFTSEEFRAAAAHASSLDKTAAHIVAVRDQLKKAGIDLVLVPLPAKADIYREHLADQTIPADLADLYGRFRETLLAALVDTVDVRPSILDAKAEGTVFLSRDTHWTPLGASRAAQALAAQTPAIAGTDDYALSPAPVVERAGDLTKFLVEGDLARPLGLTPETVHPVMAALAGGDTATGDIFGGAAVPVVLVGTSYSANEAWSFVSELKAALHSDVLNLAEEGQGPAEPMQKFLASDTFKSSPPKTVIWEFPIRYLSAPDLWDAFDRKGSP